MSSKSLRVASRLRLNVPRNAAAQSTAGACIPEMELLLECLERNDFIDLACAAQTTMLAECMGRADVRGLAKAMPFVR